MTSFVATSAECFRGLKWIESLLVRFPDFITLLRWTVGKDINIFFFYKTFFFVLLFSLPKLEKSPCPGEANKSMRLAYLLDSVLHTRKVQPIKA